MVWVCFGKRMIYHRLPFWKVGFGTLEVEHSFIDVLGDYLEKAIMFAESYKG